MHITQQIWLKENIPPPQKKTQNQTVYFLGIIHYYDYK